jgi:hypothetical protein
MVKPLVLRILLALTIWTFLVMMAAVLGLL